MFKRFLRLEAFSIYKHSDFLFGVWRLVFGVESVLSFAIIEIFWMQDSI
jgi:hypothetical protein